MLSTTRRHLADSSVDAVAFVMIYVTNAFDFTRSYFPVQSRSGLQTGTCHMRSYQDRRAQRYDCAMDMIAWAIGLDIFHKHR